MAQERRSTPPGATAVAAPTRKRPAWLIGLALLILALIIVFLLSRCGSDDSSSNSTSSTSNSSGSATTSSASSSPSSTASSPPAASATAAGGAETVTADDQPLLPLADATKVGDGGDLSAYDGSNVTATGVVVESVPADEGFWVGTSTKDRVWVQLTGGASESPYKVKQGDHVSFTGTVAKNDSGFAADAGVTDAEGKSLLTKQGEHLSVAKSDLRMDS